MDGNRRIPLIEESIVSAEESGVETRTWVKNIMQASFTSKELGSEKPFCAYQKLALYASRHELHVRLF
jgi:hypothetical protein